MPGCRTPRATRGRLAKSHDCALDARSTPRPSWLNRGSGSRSPPSFCCSSLYSAAAGSQQDPAGHRCDSTSLAPRRALTFNTTPAFFCGWCRWSFLGLKSGTLPHMQVQTAAAAAGTAAAARRLLQAPGNAAAIAAATNTNADAAANTTQPIAASVPTPTAFFPLQSELHVICTMPGGMALAR